MHDVADEFFAAVVRQAKLRRYISSDHFTVDGTLLEAWASHKSFKPKDGPPSEPPVGRNAEVGWHGEKRSNDTHESTTDPEARLARKSFATAAKMSYAGHLLMENRNALIVDAELTAATGYAERDCAVEMLARLPASRRRRTIAADKAYDTRDFVAKHPRSRLHTARRAEHHEPTIRDRWSHHPTPRPRRLAANTQTGRGTVRVDQDHRRRTQASLHRPTTKPGLVQDRSRRLQPHPNHRTRRRTSLTDRPGHPERVRQIEDSAKTGRRRATRTDTAPSDPEFHHPASASGSAERREEQVVEPATDPNVTDDDFSRSSSGDPNREMACTDSIDTRRWLPHGHHLAHSRGDISEHARSQ